ncbi:alpha/beta fold hydrolase [Nocardioides sp. GXZ039]|uniref:alpha/beta fold hydrolase n=1 Tax=Nocardioides sp. GXZ039 TaxID=3136018 RepID=UPI0030F4A9A3
MSRATSIDLTAGTIQYRDLGPADGAPIVFVHGFLVDGTVWSDVPDRLAASGRRCLVPTWPLGSHSPAMHPYAELSPRRVARLVREFLDALGLREVTLVGNDSGGAICQLVIEADPSGIDRLVLTDCDAFEVFPPFPFNLLFRLARHPRLTRALFQVVRIGAIRTGPLGFGALVDRRLSAAETLSWVTPYLTDAGVRRDVADFARAWSRADLVEVSPSLGSFPGDSLVVWARKDRFFTVALGRRLARVLDARLVELDDARTYLALDQPERLAAEILADAG